MGTPFTSKSGVGNNSSAATGGAFSALDKELYGARNLGFYQYQTQASRSYSSLVGAGDNARWETVTTPAEFAVTDLGRSADERRIFLISKGMSDVPSYIEWRDTVGKQDFKRKEWGNEVEGGWADVSNNDVYAYHSWLDNKFGADNFSRQRDGSVVVNAATSTDPAVQEARKAATSRDTGGTAAPAEGSVAAPRRGRRGATLASLESSVNKPSILGG